MSDHDPHHTLHNTLNKPSAARIYDYLLGGTHNYAIDREFADQQITLAPEIRDLAHTNRAFLKRAVTHALKNGIRQFIDIGSGLPTQGNVHDIAETHAPGQTHVIYIDNDPICQAHSQILLNNTTDPNRHHALYADYNDHHTLWQHIHNTQLIDPTKPTALLLISLLHFIPHPEEPLAYYRNQLAPGSQLAITHASFNNNTTDNIKKIADNYTQKTINQVHPRTPQHITELFGDYQLQPPGLVPIQHWNPDTNAPTSSTQHANLLGGVAHKTH